MPPYVVLPYKEYERLIKAAQALPALQLDNKRIHDQMAALRLLYSELLEKVSDLDASI